MNLRTSVVQEVSIVDDRTGSLADYLDVVLRGFEVWRMKVDGGRPPSLVLGVYREGGAILDPVLPAPLTPTEAAAVIERWLKALHVDAFGAQPNIDGHCERGWKLEARWDRVAVSPYWIGYHK